MAKFSQAKWKKRALTVLSLAMATTLSLGALAACNNETDQSDDDDTVASKTDTQLLKNGNFEFYGDKNIKDDENGKPLKKLNVINSPDSWSFSSGSPSSDTKSGIVNTAEWDYFTKTGGYAFQTYTKTSGEGDDATEEEVTTFRDIAEAYTHWEDPNVSAYDRLKFLDIYEEEIEDLEDGSEEAKLFAKYSYTVDFEDVEKLAEEVGDSLSLRSGVADDETNVLMIHNQKTSDNVRGTAQYYTSSTTITLSAGTAARVSLWVRTDNLYHYADTELNARGGAYIGVTNTVGGTTLDQMQIYNINTKGTWKQYTVYVRASTFATSTFRIVLGLGQGSSDDRYYSVDGYAFFDDVECEIISNNDYVTATDADSVRVCTVDSLKKDKQFDTDFVSEDTFALDLYAGYDSDTEFLNGDVNIGLTEEISGSNTYTSEKIDSSLGEGSDNFAAVTTLGELASSSNSYVKKVYDSDLKEKYPFGGTDSKIVMLLSANGAAYTAKLHEITLQKDERMLISFFVKTSDIDTGLTGAGAVVVDGTNKTSLSAIDSTTIAATNIDAKSDDESKKDIYKGWVQCFFFLENTTDSEKTFHIELTYGPTSIVGTNKFGFGDGYAAFTNFETKMLNKTEYSYASTGDRAKKVSLTGEIAETKMFDSVSATEEKLLEKAPALPANFRGVLGGSDFIQNNDTSKPNVKPERIDAGLLNSKYADNYFDSTEEWKKALDSAAGTASTGREWWNSLFGNARQPLVIINREAASYGYFLAETATVSSSATRRISMRVKASAGAKAYIYLTDVSSAENSGKLIHPNVPLITYWYDDRGNICRIDPADDDFDEEQDILFELAENGLYTKVGETSGTYYANLHNYETDEDGNYVTKDGTIAFYKHNDAIYANYDEEKDEYSTPVTNLPTDNARYDFTGVELPGTEMVVEGTGEWITVNFYLQAGNEAKNYRLEVWSGDRTGEHPNPVGSYVFFDNYASSDASGVFTDGGVRDLAVKAIKDRINDENGKELGDEGYIGAKDNLPAKDGDGNQLSLYYTFTFYDSTSYLRYDATLDEEELGNPYDYTQSEETEQLVFLYYMDEGEGRSASYSYFLDYSSIEKTVEEVDRDTNTDTDDETDTDTALDDMNIWLLISSAALVAVLFFVIGVFFVRWLMKKFGKKAKIKPAKDTRYRPKKGDNTPEPDAE